MSDSQSNDTVPPIHFLICESSDRWIRALQTWQTLWERAAECRLLLRHASIDEVRRHPTTDAPWLVCWELADAPNIATAQTQTIRQLAARSKRPLQIATCPRSLADEAFPFPKLSLALRQLGADWVVPDPEDLPHGKHLITRFLRAARD